MLLPHCWILSAVTLSHVRGQGALPAPMSTEGGGGGAEGVGGGPGSRGGGGWDVSLKSSEASYVKAVSPHMKAAFPRPDRRWTRTQGHTLTVTARPPDDPLQDPTPLAPL